MDCFPQKRMRLYDISDLVTSQEQQEAFNDLVMNHFGWIWGNPDSEFYTDDSWIFVLEPGWILLYGEHWVIDDIEELLAEWRAMGVNDPERDRFPATVGDQDWRQSLVTHAYLMHADTATDMLSILPQRVAPETWRDADHPDAHGTITMVRLGMMDYTPAEPEPDPSNWNEEGNESTNDSESPAEPIEFPAAMLIIEHDRSHMDEIYSELQRFSPDFWNTPSGEFRTRIPVQSVGGFEDPSGGF
jgi:hypothetical protein